MHIFTDTDGKLETENFPRSKVYKFLISYDSKLGQQYLEHIIYDKQDDSIEFTEALASIHVDKITTHSDTEKSHSKLNELLERSSNQKFFTRMLDLLRPEHEFLRERATVYGKLGNIRSAMQILLFDLKDYSCAEELALKATKFEENAESFKQVMSPTRSSSAFETLIDLYLHPPDNAEPIYDRVIDLLNRRGSKLDAQATLELLMDRGIKVEQVQNFLRKQLRRTIHTKKTTEIFSSLRMSMLLDTQYEYAKASDAKTVVTHQSMCPYCHKRLGQSAIAIVKG